MTTNEQPVKKVEFTYEGTAKEFADWLLQREHVQWQLFTEFKRDLPERNHPKIYRLKDGTPILVEYHGFQKVEIPDRDRPIKQKFVGISFVLSPLPNQETKVEAKCLHPIFQPDFDEMLNELGVKPSAKSIASPEEIIYMLPEPRGSKEWNKALWDWYYAYTENHRYSVYPDVGKLTDYFESYIRNLKSRYDAEYKVSNKGGNNRK